MFLRLLFDVVGVEIVFTIVFLVAVKLIRTAYGKKVSEPDPALFENEAN